LAAARKLLTERGPSAVTLKTSQMRAHARAVAELVAAIKEKFVHEESELHTAVTSAQLFMALTIL